MQWIQDDKNNTLKRVKYNYKFSPQKTWGKIGEKLKKIKQQEFLI